MIVNANIAWHALQTITDKNPDHVNNPNGEGMCFYQRNGEPSCGVGKALAHLGMTSDELYFMDNLSLLQGVNEVTMPDGWYLTEYARQVFAAFQSAQDNGQTWWAALEDARFRLLNPLV